MIVLGVDPGTRVTGYGVVAERDGRARVLIECGVIRPSNDLSLPWRLREIFEGIGAVIERTRPDAMCVEGVFYNRNVRTSLILGHARGAVMLAAATSGLDVAEYPPAVMKKVVVGNGSANKEQVAFMVQKHLQLETMPAPSDAADAVAIALCHLFERAALGGTRTLRESGVGRKLGS